MDKPSETAAFAGVLLAFLGIADLTAASLTELVALEYWLSNVPVRLAFLFGLTGYVYLFKEGGMFGPSSSVTAGIGEPLQNSLVFAFGFFEIAMWFWVFLLGGPVLEIVWLTSDRSSQVSGRRGTHSPVSTMRSSKPRRIGYELLTLQ